MPVENTAMNIGVRPAGNTPKAGSTDGVNRRGEGTASTDAFSPKTNVSIKNAIGDMAGVLAKIADNQTETTDKMPEVIQKLIQNVMKGSLSLTETMAEGLGSTLESQRFSMDQLGNIARMLAVLGTLSEKEGLTGVSENMAALLSNLKLALTEDSASLEPALIAKNAFELLDGKEETALPKELREMLTSLGTKDSGLGALSANSETTKLVKQLVDFLMPRAENNTSANTNQNTNAANNQTVQNQAAAAAQGKEALPEGNISTAKTEVTVNNGTANNANTKATDNTTTANTSANTDAASENNTVSNTANANKDSSSLAAKNTMAENQAATAKNTADTVKTNSGAEKSAINNTQASENAANIASKTANVEGKTSALTAENAAKGANPTGDLAANATKSELKNKGTTGEPLENTVAAANVMKSLATLMLKENSLTAKDALLLQSFVNGKEELLNAKETRELRQLIKLCQQSVPASVQQAAIKQNIPDLPRLWAFMQLCDMAGTRKLNARTLKKAGKDVNVFVMSMRSAMEGDNATVQGSRSLNFMLPMYMEDTVYPSYIYVYDEKKQDEATGELKKETWLRLCILTDNIGAVEITCRVYNGDALDLKLFFSSNDILDEFKENVAELKESLKSSSLKLSDFKLTSPVETVSV